MTTSCDELLQPGPQHYRGVILCGTTPLSVLAPPHLAPALRAVVFRETSTIGLRETRVAKYDEKTLDLGATEFRLIEFLARNVGVTFSRSQLLERVWDYDFEGSSNIVDVYVSQLRKKLRHAGATSAIIETVWGVGYKLVA